MALDGITLGLIKKELSEYLIGSKTDKIHQPSKNELVFIMRTRNGAYRLYLSCDGQSPRVHMTRYNLENPKTPPMLCMLLRKRLGSGRLKQVRQFGFDRVLLLDFDCKNELGDDVVITVIVEMLGRLCVCGVSHQFIVSYSGWDLHLDAMPLPYGIELSQPLHIELHNLFRQREILI